MAETQRAAPSLAQEVSAARALFGEAGARTPDLDARLLAQAAFALGSAELLLRGSDSPAADALERFRRMVERRLSGEPVHRILGRRAFYDHEFELSPQTLEPRPDTEILVDLAAKALRERGRAEATFADLGTGSGAIAVSLLSKFPGTFCVAIDLSPEALTTARVNAVSAGVAARFLPVVGDYLAPLGSPLDMLVSNPPYIPTGEIERLDPEVREHDPIIALDGGPDGLDAYRAMAAALSAADKQPADVLLEVGAGQPDAVTTILSDAGYRLVEVATDLAGHPRALWFRNDR